MAKVMVVGFLVLLIAAYPAEPDCAHPTLRWVQPLPDTMGAYIAVDSASDVVLYGCFLGQTDFDFSNKGQDIRVPTTNPAPGFDADIFVAKYDHILQYQWAYTIGGLEVDCPEDLKIAPDNSLYMAGAIKGRIDFDPGPGEEVHEAPADQPAGFITKLSPEGNHVWTPVIKGTASVNLLELDVDSEGNVYFAGGFGGAADFDPGPGVELRESGVSNVFVAKFDSKGNYIWAKTFGGTGFDYATDLVIHDDSSLFVRGYFRNAADFDPGSGEDWHVAVDNPIGENRFLTKLGTDGTYDWTRTSNVLGSALATTADGGVVLGGTFADTVDVDPTSGEDWRTAHAPEHASGRGDILVVKINGDGSYGWAYTAGGGGADTALEGAVDPWGDIVIKGSHTRAIDFDPGPGVAIITPQGSGDNFLLRLSGDGSFNAVLPLWDWIASGRILVDAEGSMFMTRKVAGPVDMDPSCEEEFHQSETPGKTTSFFLTRWDCPTRDADFNADGAVDLRDLAAFQNCFTGPTDDLTGNASDAPCNPGCDEFDLSTDNAIDAADFGELAHLLTGPVVR